MSYIQWDPDYAIHHGTEANGLNKQDWLFKKKCCFWPVLQSQIVVLPNRSCKRWLSYSDNALLHGSNLIILVY